MQPIVFGASLFAAEPEAQWRLPKRLREISGLAATPDGRVMGHDDEAGVIYEIDVATGETVKRFCLGQPPIKGDFEGLAIAASGEFYLTTSGGRVHRFREGEAGAVVPFETFETGLRRTGEIEGLAWCDGEDALILACKRTYADTLSGQVA
ncbi:MAG TPA: hypothetical protein VG939_16085, partial [Caulobacteraceae bacterium]|nr:hypothetical protein [Caulobacteraceae bacterium]